ncbi:hypothetical protein SAMN02745121_03163 [Nannocystis exedens]|uniref:Uncharacterized protein n=1 Tax=Nannocystis exedens TaxID=54 RepID=A0A1I1Y4G1_9BACT|nr:hypothetical protein [Nannocystis exedens]PCC71811.1 membrane protein [Nannocystis exedens]SFE14517.1 hypothetical protein SAMN02745121_03163 [Nannocystis exedens]
MSDAQAWLALLGLGAFHGINPGMGWLFAVALGLQEQRRAAVLRALLPIALGHALSIAVVLLVIGVLKDALPDAWVRWPVGLGLTGFGLYKLVRCRHPRWVGMRVSSLDLTWWSFLMATAHGAGLMLAPVLLGWRDGPAVDHASMHEHLHHAGHHAQHAVDGAGAHAGHAQHLAELGASTPLLGLLATALHTLGYLLVMGLVAVVVYEKVGLAILRKAWFNLDVLWAAALVITGIVTLAL